MTREKDKVWAETLQKAAKHREAGKTYQPIPPNYCVPQCDTCGGTGYFTYDVPVHHHEFGKIHPCPNKPVTIKGTGIDDTYKELSWDDILPEGNAQEAVSAVRNVLALGSGWVYLWGKPCKAKTLILQRAVKEAHERGLRAQYTQTAEVLGWLREAFDAEHKQRALDSRLEALASQQVLAIDELDRFNNTPWANEQVFRIMDNRYRSALHGNTATIMAANVPPSVYEPYLKDRIQDGRFQIIHLTGESLRPAADRSMP